MPSNEGADPEVVKFFEAAAPGNAPGAGGILPTFSGSKVTGNIAALRGLSPGPVSDLNTMSVNFPIATFQANGPS